MDNNLPVSHIDVSDKALSRSDTSESFGYYAFTDPSGAISNESNIESFERPLIVNCAGNFTSSFLFTTDRKQGRYDYLLIYINAGKLTFFDKDRPIEASTGNVIILPANVPHKYTNVGCDKLNYFWIHFTGSEAASRLEEYSLSSFPTIYKTTSGNHIYQRFQGIFEAFSRRNLHLDRELSALFERLLITVSRSILQGDEKISTLTKSIGFIRSNYSTDIRIGQLAKMEHLSVSRYNCIFKEQMGIPPTKYILGLRMSSAKELLSSTDLPVKQIGIMCGYGDPHFFSKTFKAYLGVSPAEYRRGSSHPTRK